MWVDAIRQNGNGLLSKCHIDNREIRINFFTKIYQYLWIYILIPLIYNYTTPPSERKLARPNLELHVSGCNKTKKWERPLMSGDTQPCGTCTLPIMGRQMVGGKLLYSHAPMANQQFDFDYYSKDQTKGTSVLDRNTSISTSWEVNYIDDPS